MVWPKNGQTNMYTDLIDEFVLEKHNVYVATLCEKRNRIKTNLAFENGVNVLRIQCGNIQKTNKYKKVISSFLAGFKLKGEIIKRFGKVHFDLLVFALPPLTIAKPVVKIKKHFGCPMYLLLKEFWPQDPADLGAMRRGGFVWKVFKRLEDYMYKNSDYIGAMSEAGVSYLSNNKNTEHSLIEVNPNSEKDRSVKKTLEEIKAIRKRFDLSTDEKIFIFGGNLGVSQGIPEMIASIKNCSDIQGIRFLIVGDGTEKNVVVRELSNQNNVTILDSMDKKNYSELVSCCDFGLIFLYPKYTVPNFPSRAVSYLCYGLPILAAIDLFTDVGKVIEGNGCGLSVINGDIDGFRHKIKNIVYDCEYETMSNNCIRLFKKEFTARISYEKIVEKVE